MITENFDENEEIKVSKETEYVNKFEYNGLYYITDAKEYYETGKKILSVPWLKEAKRSSRKYDIGSLDEKLFFTVMSYNSENKEFWRTPEEYSKLKNVKLDKSVVEEWYNNQEKIRKGELFQVNSMDGFKYKSIELENNKIKEFKQSTTIK